MGHVKAPTSTTADGILPRAVQSYSKLKCTGRYTDNTSNLPYLIRLNLQLGVDWTKLRNQIHALAKQVFVPVSLIYRSEKTTNGNCNI
jgi:hypothetical protein